MLNSRQIIAKLECREGSHSFRLKSESLQDGKLLICLRYSEAKQCQNTGVWSRESFIAGESGLEVRGGHRVYEGFQQSIFKGKVKEGAIGYMISSCTILMG